MYSPYAISSFVFFENTLYFRRSIFILQHSPFSAFHSLLWAESFPLALTVSVLPVRLSFSFQARWAAVLFVVRPIPHTPPFLYRLTHWYNSPLLIPAHIAVSFMDAPANTFATNSYFWSGVHSLFCSSYVILLHHTHLPCDPTHESYPETSFPLHRAVFQATALVDIGRHTSVCIHSCTSWKYPQYWMSSIGGTYQKFTDLYFLDESCVTAVARCSD